MRDYRGKREITEGWEYGSLLRYADGDMAICCTTEDPDALNQYLVSPETVGQCTGVFGDFIKGDPEPGDNILRSFIYEGDIVEPVLMIGTHEVFSWGKQVVVFDRGAFCLKDHRGITTPLYNYAANVQFRVLGNVHDNPELLEVSE